MTGDTSEKIATLGSGRFVGLLGNRKAMGIFALVVLASGLIITFWPLLTAKPSSIAGRYDVYRYFGPLAFYMDYCIHHGDIPWWNPQIFCGMPYAGNPQTGFFYPPNLIRSLLNFDPTLTSTHVSMIVRLGIEALFSAWGAYLLARRHRYGFAGALTSAVSFGFSALMIRRLCEYLFVSAYGWVPWALLCVRNMVEAETARERIRWAAGGGLVYGMCCLSGFLPLCNFIALTMGVYALLLIITRSWGDKEEGRASEPLTWGRIVTDFWPLILLFTIATGVAIAMLFPTYQLAQFSARKAGVVIPPYSDLPAKGLFLLVQDFIVYAGMRYEPEGMRNAGFIGVFLAFAALMVPKRRDLAIFGVLFLMLLDCSMGPPFPVASIVDKITPFEQSAFSRAYDIAILPLSMLSGLGVEALLRQRNTVLRKSVFSAVLAILGAVALFHIYKWMTPRHFLYGSPSLVQWRVIVPAMAVAFVIACLWLPYLARFSLILVTLFFAETLLWNVRFVPYLLSKSNTYVEEHPIDAAKTTFPQDNRRGADPMANWLLFGMETMMTGYDPLHLQPMREVLMGPPRSRQYHRLVNDQEVTEANQRGNLFLKRLFWLSRSWANGKMPPREKVFPAATTVFIGDPPVDSGLAALPEVRADQVKPTALSEETFRTDFDASALLVRPYTSKQAKSTIRFRVTLPQAVPGRLTGPAGAVHSTLCLQYKSNVSANLSSLFSNTDGLWSERGYKQSLYQARNAERLVSIPLPDYPEMDVQLTLEIQSAGEITFTQAYILSDKLDEDGLITIESRGPNHAHLKVGPLPEARIISFMDAMYPGWKVYVDDKPGVLLTVNEVFKGVVVPAGEHTVRFEYVPLAQYVAALVSMISMLGCLYLLIGRRKPFLPGEAQPIETTG